MNEFLTCSFKVIHVIGTIFIICKGVLAFLNPPPPYVKTFSVHKVSENCDFLNPPPPTPMSLGNIKMVPYLNKAV